MPLSLSNRQMEIVTDAARALPVERRSEFLRRIASMLTLRGQYNDRIVTEACALALIGIDHERRTDAA
jgi:hypothetical protein